MAVRSVAVAVGLVLLGVGGPAAGIEGPVYIVGQLVEATVVHPFDDLDNAQAIGTYRGFTYHPSSRVLCTPFPYSYWGLPPSPESPRCLAYSPDPMVIQVPVEGLGLPTTLKGWRATAAPFVNPDGIAIELDILGGVARGSCKSNFGAGARFELTAELPMQTVRISAPADYWMVDHLVFERSVPLESG